MFHDQKSLDNVENPHQGIIGEKLPPPGLDDPYMRYLVNILMEEPRSQGVYEGPGPDKRREILYGVGTLALMGIFFPQFREKVKTIVNQTTMEGLDLFEKARSLMARAKEDVEDLIAEARFSELMKRPRE